MRRTLKRVSTPLPSTCAWRPTAQNTAKCATGSRSFSATACSATLRLCARSARFSASGASPARLHSCVASRARGVPAGSDAHRLDASATTMAAVRPESGMRLEQLRKPPADGLAQHARDGQRQSLPQTHGEPEPFLLAAEARQVAGAGEEVLIEEGHRARSPL